ncbi:Serine/threonine-protein kinase BRSK2 [Lucilia cuprina]|nr:Serine/threonine-protein kinase BRSK2 [Lucilia cuprina]
MSYESYQHRRSPRYSSRKLQVSADEVHLTPESSPELTNVLVLVILINNERMNFTDFWLKESPLPPVKAHLNSCIFVDGGIIHSVALQPHFVVEYKR